MTGSTDHATWNGSLGVHNRHAQQERRSRLLLLHEGSSLRRLVLRGAGWRLTKRGSPDDF
jgi:hypothetical protein